ncbi:MAG: nucleotidyltransferase domain-containing protein [Thermodesulfovibrionales bacterium]|nr:nucleotidyltransferase domain-containing protein [Thermodesulfovibrionales bacterium]
MAKINAAIVDRVRKFLAKLEEHGIHVEKAYLYGSYAKGIENKWSDIDVAVISHGFTYDRFEERIRLMKIASDIDLRIEPVPFRPDTFADEDPLVWEIKKEGVVIEHLPKKVAV